MSEKEEIAEENEMEVDDSSSDSEGENAEESKLEEDAKKLLQEPNDWDYDYHVKLIDTYKKLMKIEELRAAFEKFKDFFPLTGQLWLDWIKIETGIACTDIEKQNIIRLFELGVKDYLSVDLWLEYVQFSVGFHKPEQTREIFEQAVTIAGLHVSKGSLIWDAYREFELAHLSCIETGSENWETQAKKVYEIFKRQLSETLLDMERTFIEFLVWVEKLPNNEFVNREEVESRYKKAKKYLDDYKDYEDKLTTDENKFVVYKEYIKFEREPELIICLYERAISDFCLSPDLWYDYCIYLFKLDDYKTCSSTLDRALRNCSWSESLWVFHLQILELCKESHQKITAALEKALSTQLNQYLNIWLTYLNYFKRITNPDDDKSTEKLRAVFQKAYTHIMNDHELLVLRFWARLEANFLKNMPEARRIYNDCILENLGDNAKVWLEFIELEQRFGDEKHLRKTYQRAVNRLKLWSQPILDNWLIYERENGTVDTFINYSLTRESIDKKIAENSNVERKRTHETDKKYHKTKQGKVIKENKPKPEIIKPVKEVTDVEMKETKKFDKIDYDEEKSSRSVFISNLDYSVTETQLEEILGPTEELRLVKDSKNNSRGYAYAVFSTIDLAQKTLLRDREKIDGRPVFLSKCNPDKQHRDKVFKYAVSQEKHKLFIKGLPFSTTDVELKQIYEKYGEVKDIRIITYRNGKSKGMAFVEYINQADAAKAVIGTDNMDIDGMKISVAISDPPKRKYERKEPEVHVSDRPKGRLQMPLVPRSVQVSAPKNTTTLTNDDFRKMLLNDK